MTTRVLGEVLAGGWPYLLSLALVASVWMAIELWLHRRHDSESARRLVERLRRGGGPEYETGMWPEKPRVWRLVASSILAIVLLLLTLLGWLQSLT